ncbi:MAG: Peptidase M16C associated domain protein [Desulfonauticus sp. 38_4375]|nr:MAG: Peptidase M16C associated domain protein [Desulfonauticus sp. 38_4375]
MDKFTLIKSFELKEKDCKINYFLHQKTKARVLSIQIDDPNKVFGISFKTPPNNNTGLPHILEHSVLCGSKKYPVKEPFVELLKSSLQTFLNAMTYPDKTCYPVASTNLRDFYNLVDVYLDAVFFPLLHPFTFAQEGWHYELSSLEEELKIKGVVYNEMKGAYSSPDNLLAEYSQQSLFPDTPYCFDAGGKPEEIVKLTYEDFLAFHKQYYHPSNAWIYFYGDDPEAERLRLLENYLEQFSWQQVLASVPGQKPKKMLQEIVVPYGVSSEEEKGSFTLNWLLAETKDVETNLAFRILEEMLIGLPSSPLRKKLIESGLGEGLAGIGLETELRQMYFSLGLKGIKLQDIPKAEAIISSTLEELATGIDKKLKEAAFNSVEFSLRENNTGSYPQGLSLMLRTLSIWLYSEDFEKILDLDPVFSSLRKKLEGNFWESLIARYFLQNEHRTKVVLKPQKGLLEQKEQETRANLRQLKESFSKDKLTEIVKTTQELLAFQQRADSPEDLAKIPRLKKEDLSEEIESIEVKRRDRQGIPFFVHPLGREEIVYLDLGFNLQGISQEELLLVPTLGRLLLEMGTRKRDYVDLNNELYMHTGGIHPEIVVEEELSTKNPLAYLFFRSKVLTSKLEHLLDLLEEIFTQFNFVSPKRLEEILLEEKSSLERRIIPAGHLFVLKRLKSKFSLKGKLEDLLEGIEYFKALKDITGQLKKNKDALLARYESLAKKILTGSRLVVNITLPRNRENLVSRVEDFVSSFPVLEGKGRGDFKELLGETRSEGFIVPAEVNYLGLGVKLEEDYLGGDFLVFSKFLRANYLWNKIRVEGGAYGAFALADVFSGTLYFVSYRDPNDLRTLQVYESLLQGKQFLLPAEELEKLVVAAIGELEKHKLPDAKGFESMLYNLKGLNEEKRQLLKKEVLATNLETLQKWARQLKNIKQKEVVGLGKEESLKALKEQALIQDLSQLL